MSAPPASAQVGLGSDAVYSDGLGYNSYFPAPYSISPGGIVGINSEILDDSEFGSGGERQQVSETDQKIIIDSGGLGAVLLPKEFNDWVGSEMEHGAGWDNLVVPGIGTDPDTNPIVTPESLKRYLEILPYMIVGPEGPSRVIPGIPTGVKVFPPEGAVASMRDPASLNWNGGLEGDLTCFKPETVRPDAIAGQINAARMLTTLVAGLPGALERVSDSQVAAWRLERCSADTASTHVRHCTGLLEPTGKTVWTAAHCLINADTGLVEEAIRNIGIGENRSCSTDTAFRAVSLLGLTNDDFIIPEGFMQPCEHVERLADDIVRVSLVAPLQVVPADGDIVSPWRLPAETELNELLIEGRRVYGTGFLQSAVLYDLMGGRVMPITDCLVTLAGRLGHLPPNPTWAEIHSAMDQMRDDIPSGALTYQGYGCTSMDTMNGSSGGPVFALTDDATEMVLVGFISAASYVDHDMECQTTLKTPLQDQCGVVPLSGLNLFSVLPNVSDWGRS